MSDKVFILSRNYSIFETTSDFHRVSFKILQQWQNKLKIINSDETSEDSNIDLKKNSENDEVDLILKTDDLNSLISIMSYIQLLINLTISQLTCRIDSNSIKLNII